MSLGAAYEGDDFYCDRAIPNSDQLNIVFEDDRVLAYHHTRPFWETHIVVAPRRHIGSLTTVTDADEDDIRALLKVVQEVAREVETTQGAAAVLTNLGAYQDSKHLHVHVHSGPRRSGHRPDGVVPKPEGVDDPDPVQDPAVPVQGPVITARGVGTARRGLFVRSARVLLDVASPRLCGSSGRERYSRRTVGGGTSESPCRPHGAPELVVHNLVLGSVVLSVVPRRLG